MQCITSNISSGSIGGLMEQNGAELKMARLSMANGCFLVANIVRCSCLNIFFLAGRMGNTPCTVGVEGVKPCDVMGCCSGLKNTPLNLV